jgi:hypothetical protein
MSSLSLSPRLQNSATEQCNNPRYEKKMKGETREVLEVEVSRDQHGTEWHFEVVLAGFGGGESHLSKHMPRFRERWICRPSSTSARFGRENERKRNKSRKLVIECLSSVARSILLRFSEMHRRVSLRNFPPGKLSDAMRIRSQLTGELLMKPNVEPMRERELFSRHGGANAETASGNLSSRAATTATTLSSSGM